MRNCCKSSLDIGSRIIRKNKERDIFNSKYLTVGIGEYGRGKNWNTIILNDLLKRDYWKMSKLDIVNYAEINFLRYLDEKGVGKKGNVVVDLKDENHLLGLQNKYCIKYKEKIKRRMRWLCHKYKNSDCVLLTLTLNPGLFNNDLVDMWSVIKTYQDIFFRKLRYHLKKQGKTLPKYIATIECQHGEKSWMNPHIHILFLDAKRLMNWYDIEKIWQYGFIWINRTKGRKKIRKPVDYITKYITKTYTDTSEENITDQAIQWLFNIRSFSSSQGLIYPLNYVDEEQALNKLFFVNCESDHIFNWFKNQNNLDRLVDYYYDLEKYNTMAG